MIERSEKQPPEKWDKQNKRPRNLPENAAGASHHPKPCNQAQTDTDAGGKDNNAQLRVSHQEVDNWGVIYHNGNKIIGHTRERVAAKWMNELHKNQASRRGAVRSLDRIKAAGASVLNRSSANSFPHAECDRYANPGVEIWLKSPPNQRLCRGDIQLLVSRRAKNRNGRNRAVGSNPEFEEPFALNALGSISKWVNRHGGVNHTVFAL
jgi:hypothetical protein